MRHRQTARLKKQSRPYRYCEIKVKCPLVLQGGLLYNQVASGVVKFHTGGDAAFADEPATLLLQAEPV